VDIAYPHNFAISLSNLTHHTSPFSIVDLEFQFHRYQCLNEEMIGRKRLNVDTVASFIVLILFC